MNPCFFLGALSALCTEVPCLPLHPRPPRHQFAACGAGMSGVSSSSLECGGCGPLAYSWCASSLRQEGVAQRAQRELVTHHARHHAPSPPPPCLAPPNTPAPWSGGACACVTPPCHQPLLRRPSSACGPTTATLPCPSTPTTATTISAPAYPPPGSSSRAPAARTRP